MPNCSFEGCTVQGVLPECNICKKPVCIKHYELVRDMKNPPFGVVAECHRCFKKHPDSQWEQVVY